MGSDVIVVGSGVIGLTTAIVLAESGRNVRIWTKDPAQRTTSAVAGAIWGPYRAGPEELVRAWSQRTFHTLAGLAEKPAETGVRMVSGFGATRTPELPWWTEPAQEVRPARPGELPPGYRTGYRARLPLVDMPVHLTYLLRRFEAAGGRVEQHPVASLAEAAQEAPYVVNCTGLGARALVPDPEMHPVRGQLVVVENCGIDEWFVEAGAHDAESVYIFPHPDRVILGGTAYDDVWSRTPDPRVAEAIVSRCVQVDPRLGAARILEHRVGLRPYRPLVRLESEPLAHGAVCVHNYGHGGSGITLSWACAADAAALVPAS